ncbi:MAG: ABC transporter ATP-binding protein [Eubacteriales bacterium]|nr:ABC transporter ATP-binding protein [Eubacteriales bacterium]
MDKPSYFRYSGDGGRLRVFFQERLGSLMIVRTFVQERQTEEKAAALMKEHKTARMCRNRFSNICNIGFGAVMNGAYALGAAFCGYGILSGTMSYGNFMAILQLIGQVQNPFANITGYLPKYYAMIASAERLMEVENFEDEYTDTVPEAELRRFYEEEFCGLGLRDAVFTYEPPVETEEAEPVMPAVLSGLNLEIKKGEHVAFTGLSGCGKSTVLKLLMCLYPLDSGERYLLTRQGELPLTPAWRGLFAYVPQGNQLLSGTIREIVAFGDSDKMYRDKRLWNALEIACAEVFVSELDQGLDTMLGERGAGLSEGQMQRIAIARAVFSEHPVLFLDEATSALDEATAAQLLGNLRTMTDKTVILVTHRTSTKVLIEKEVMFSKDGILIKK